MPVLPLLPGVHLRVFRSAGQPFYGKRHSFNCLWGQSNEINLVLLPIIGFQVVGANYFQAVGKPIQAAFLGLSRQVLVLIPTLLILPRFLGITGVWLPARFQT